MVKLTFAVSLISSLSSSNILSTNLYIVDVKEWNTYTREYNTDNP